MKRLPVAVFPFLLSVLLAACHPRHGASPADGYAGYAEADAVPFASVEAGRVERVYVRRGERAAAGAPLFALSGQEVRTAPDDVEVADVMVREGDMVAVSQPVLTLLAQRQLRARFYVPRERLQGLAPGRAVVLSCDGCGDGLPARISFVAHQSEPDRPGPVFLVEARPDASSSGLRAGQPVMVRLAGAATD
nr:HlyD family efflux transporter periplasmic adaptor subunit [uncultured Massilia sp.]